MRLEWNIAVLQLMTAIFSVSHGADFQLPMWLDDTLRGSRGKDSDKVYLDAGCTLKIINSQCTSAIQPYGDGCRTLFNLKKLLKGYWKLKDFHKITDRDIPAESFEVILLTVDNCKESLTFTANNTETINFLDKYLVLKNATLMVTFDSYHNQVINNTEISIDLKSSAEFNNKKVSLRIYKDFNETKYAISINGTKITLGDILVALRSDKTFPETFCADVDTDELFGIEFHKLRMHGVYNVSKGFYLSATSITKRLESNDTSYVEVIIVRQRYKPIKLAVILKGKLQTDILPFLTDLLQRRSDGIPIYNRTFDIGILSISNAKLKSNQFLSDSHLDRIDKGLVLQTAESVIEKRSPLLNNRTTPKNMIRTKLNLCKSRDEIDFNPKSEIDLEEFLTNIHKSSDLDFPDWLKTDGSVTAIITKVTVTGSNREKVSVKANIIALKKIFFNLLKINNVEVEFLINRGKEKVRWDCGILNKDGKLSKTDVEIALTCDEGLENFRFIITAPVFSFTELLDLLKVDLLPSQLKTTMEKIVEFEIRNFRVEVSQDDDEFIRITGSPMLFGLKNLTMEGLCWQENGEKKLAVGIVIKDVNLDDLFESIIGKKLGIAWIGHTRAAILLSNTKLETATKRQNVVRIDQLGTRTSNTSDTNHSNARPDNVTTNTTVAAHSRKRRSPENFFVQEPGSVQPQAYNPIQNGIYGDTKSQSYQSPPQALHAFPSGNSNSVIQYSNTDTVSNLSYASQSFIQPAYSFDPTVALLKTTDSTGPPKDDTHSTNNNEKLMDELVNAYKESNQEKAYKNYEQQQEINEGVLDDLNDKRSVLPHRQNLIDRKTKIPKNKHQSVQSGPHYRTKFNNERQGKRHRQLPSKHHHRSRKRSEINRSNPYVQDEAAVRRDYINSHYISNQFKKDYLRWLQHASGRRSSDTRENIANIFDDVYSENTPAAQTSAYVLANDLTQEQLSKYVNKAGYVTKTQVPYYRQVASRSHHNGNKGIYADVRYMPKAYTFDQVTHNLQGKAQTPPAESDREEYGTEKEAVGVIPETGADVYNLYRKRHKPMTNNQRDAMEEDNDEDELPAKGPVNGKYRMDHESIGHGSLHDFRSDSAHDSLSAHPEFKTEKISAVDIESDQSKQDENNDLIEEYAKLNAQLASINEPTLSPIWSPQKNHQDEIQKELFHHKHVQPNPDATEPAQKQPVFNVYKQKDVANYILQKETKTHRQHESTTESQKSDQEIDQSSIMPEEDDVGTRIKEQKAKYNQSRENGKGLNATNSKLEAAKVDSESKLKSKSQNNNSSRNTTALMQNIRSKNYRFIPMKVNEFRVNLKQNRLFATEQDSKSPSKGNTNGSNSTTHHSNSNLSSSHYALLGEKNSIKSNNSSILHGISNETISKADRNDSVLLNGNRGNATENQTSVVNSNVAGQKAIDQNTSHRKDKNDTEDIDDITIIATTGGHHRHHLENKTKAKDSVFHLQLTEDVNQTKLEQNESTEKFVNATTTHQNTSLPAKQSSVQNSSDGSKEDRGTGNNTGSPSVNHKMYLEHPFMESTSETGNDGNPKVVQYKKDESDGRNSNDKKNIDTHIEIYNGKQLIGRKNVTSTGNVFNNITEEDDDEKGGLESDQKPIDSHKFLDDLLPHGSREIPDTISNGGSIFNQVPHHLRRLRIGQPPNEIANVIHDENQNDDFSSTQSDNSLLHLNGKGALESKEALGLALKALQIKNSSTPGLNIGNSTTSDSNEDDSVDNVNQVENKETDRMYETAAPDEVDAQRSHKHTSKLNSEKNELSLEDDDKNGSEYSIDESNSEATEGKTNTTSDQDSEGDDTDAPSDANHNLVKGNTDSGMGEALTTHDDDTPKESPAEDPMKSSESESASDTDNTNSATSVETNPVTDDAIKDISIKNSDGSVKVSNDEDDDYLKDESLKQTASNKTEEEDEEGDYEKDDEDNENSKSKQLQKPIEIQEGEDTKDLDAKALTALVQKNLNEAKDEGGNMKQDDGESDERLVNVGGRTNEEDLDDSSRNVEKVAHILSHFGHDYKHNQHNINSMKNKSLYLVKNKNLQVLMEIRPDSKTNDISVETQGLANIYKNHEKGSNHLPNSNQSNYTYVDQDSNFEDSLTNLAHIHKKDQHRIVHLKRKSHHQGQDNQIPLLQRELTRQHAGYNKEHNKQKYKATSGNVEDKTRVKDSESIDDSISKADFDDSVVNEKYESIYRPLMHKWKKPVGIELKNDTNIEDALNEEVKSEITKIGGYEANEDNIYLGNASPRTNIFNKTHRVKMTKTFHAHPNKKVRRKLGLGRSFTKMDDIIEAYQVMNSNKEKYLEQNYRNGMLDIKRGSIPETSDDAYNLYNNTIDFGEDLLQSDELKHNSNKQMKGQNVVQNVKTAKKNKEDSKSISNSTNKRKNKNIPSKKHNSKNKKSKHKRHKTDAERKNMIHRRQRSKSKKENHSDISKNLQESMEGRIHYSNPIEEAIREYLYPSDDEELPSKKEPAISHKVQRNKKTNRHAARKKHTRGGHHRRSHRHRSHHQREQGNLGSREHQENTFNGLSTGTIIVQQEIKSDPPATVMPVKSHSHKKHQKSSHQTPQVAPMNKKQVFESAVETDSTLSNEKQPVHDNGTITNSEESPGEQKEPTDILESFKVWIENTTTADLKMADDVIRRSQKNTKGEYTKNSTRKEVIGTTLKGKSRNLQFGLNQQKRADGKLHGHSQTDGAKNETKLKKFQNLDTEKNVTKPLIQSPVIIHMNNSLATIASVNGSLLFKNNTLGKMESNHTHSVGVAKSLKNTPKEFLTEELKKLAIDAGISIDVEFAAPDECGDNKMCLFVKEMLSDADALKLSGSFSSKGVELTLKYPGISDLSDAMKLKDIAMTLSIQGMNSNIWIKADLKLKDPPLQFKGSIALGATGNLQFDMKMIGIWNKPFGIDSLAIGNALLGISYQPGAPMPSFELGGELWLGVLGSGNEIKARVFFGFDPSNPSGNYFYGKLDKLSIDDLIKAFNKTLTLPTHLKESGFPKGLLVAFTSNPKGIELSKENVRVDFGFMISGTINILGYEGACKLKLTSDEIDIDVKLSPIELARGLVKMHRDIDDSANGPEFALRINKNEVYVKAEGVACLLGIQAASKLSITNQHFQLSLKANLFDLLEGNLLVQASADQDVSTATFKLDGCLSVKLEKLSEAIIKNLNALSGMAKKAINRVKEKVEKANNLYTRAKAELTEQEARIKEKELELNGDTRQLLRNRHEISANCFADCPKVCQGSYVDEPLCLKTFGRWLSCRAYKSCVKRTQDLQCILKCENEKFKKRGYNLMSKFVVKMKLAALAGARISLKFAKMFAKLAKIPQSLAKSLLNAIEKLVTVGTEVAGRMAKMALEDLLQVHYFCINANLAETDGLCTGFNASLSIMKSTLKMAGNLCINGKTFDNLGNDAIEQQYPESKTMKTGLKEKEKDFEKLERESEKAEKQEHKMKDKTVRKKAKRLYVPSAVEHYYQKVLYEPEPTYSFHNDIVTALYGHQGNNNNISNKDGSFNLENIRHLTSSNSSCENLTQTLYSYNEIASGLDKVLQQQKAERQYIEKLKTDIQDLLIRNELASTNMSNYDQQEYDWYAATLRNSYNKWLNKTSTRFAKRQKLVIPKFVDDLHRILQYRNIADLQEYMKNLHDQAKTATAGKRSSIITTPLSEEENLQDIRRGFDEILFRKDFTLLDDKISELAKLQRKLVLAQTFNKICTVAFDKNG